MYQDLSAGVTSEFIPCWRTTNSATLPVHTCRELMIWQGQLYTLDLPMQ